ncbi:DUF4145 domain-containing protein [bacterium]|nr:MAG: DUF4145 domain-containing protein [bacterium]
MRMGDVMLIDCPYCKSKVSATVGGQVQHYDPREDPYPYRVRVGSCPQCHTVLVGIDEQVPTDEFDEEQEPTWSTVSRFWPQPKRYVPWYVPDVVRTSLEEADRCYHAGAFLACAVMCGRALEGICNSQNAKTKTLHEGLQELQSQGLIDQRLFRWGEELRKHRNLGAHATPDRISGEDASDLLDFVHAITEYIFVLTRKFDDFMSRRAPKAPALPPQP